MPTNRFAYIFSDRTKQENYIVLLYCLVFRIIFIVLFETLFMRTTEIIFYIW